MSYRADRSKRRENVHGSLGQSGVFLRKFQPEFIQCFCGKQRLECAVTGQLNQRILKLRWQVIWGAAGEWLSYPVIMLYIFREKILMEFVKETLEINGNWGFQWIGIHVILLQKVMQLWKHLKIPTLRTGCPTLQLFFESVHFVREGQDVKGLVVTGWECHGWDWFYFLLLVLSTLWQVCYYRITARSLICFLHSPNIRLCIIVGLVRNYQERSGRSTTFLNVWGELISFISPTCWERI